MRKGEFCSRSVMYRQYELYYVIGDERDIVRLRTNYRRYEDVYLYHLTPATPERSRAFFLEYVKTANELHKRAQWYNELFSNCTTNVRLHAKDIGYARRGTGKSLSTALSLNTPTNSGKSTRRFHLLRPGVTWKTASKSSGWIC